MAEILKTQVFSKEQRQKRNYLIHLLYVRREFDECLLLIEDTLAQVNEVCPRMSHGLARGCTLAFHT